MSETSYAEHCALMRFVGIFSGKWILPIIYHLIEQNKAVRFSELGKVLSPITQKELSKQLKILEKHQLIQKTIYPEIPPKVEYQITALGLTLKQPIQNLGQWMDVYEKQMCENA